MCADRSETQGVVKATRKAESRRVRRPVSRVLSSPESDGWPFLWDARCRAPRATDPSGGAKVRPAFPRTGMPAAPTWSCSRWGFPCRRRCRRRGALLPHRFTLAARPVFRDGPAVYFLWHFPWGRPRRALPGTVPPWSPDFPPSAQRRRAAIRPSGWDHLGRRATSVKPGSANRRPITARFAAPAR